MSSDLALSARGVSKAYTIAHNATDHVTMAEVVLHKTRHPLRRPEREKFWALRDIDFDLHKGEVLGLIGRNGAGKSTLLKLLGRITPPTEGEIRLWGRVGSLLEVGTGFHPELTGRENIFLNGSILGMTTAEIRGQFDAIVDFAGVEKFLDTPVKRYSSGMFVRLAFAVAAHLETEILLVDEVLSVGDAEFQKKCLAKIRDVATNGRTVLLVSHQLRNIEELCDRVMLLEDGEVNHLGDVAEGLTKYLSQSVSAELNTTPPAERQGSGSVRVTSVGVPKQNLAVEEPKKVVFTAEYTGDGSARCAVDLIFRNSDGAAVAHCSSGQTGQWIETASGPVEVETILITPWLHPGEYTIDIWLWNYEPVDIFENAIKLVVRPGYPYAAGAPEAQARRDLVPPDIAFCMSSSEAARARVPTPHSNAK